jgi:hypothetical protein
LFKLGDPKNEVKEPCLSFFGAEDGDDTAADRDDVAFLFTFMVDATNPVQPPTSARWASLLIDRPG